MQHQVMNKFICIATAIVLGVTKLVDREKNITRPKIEPHVVGVDEASHIGTGNTQTKLSVPQAIFHKVVQAYIKVVVADVCEALGDMANEEKALKQEQQHLGCYTFHKPFEVSVDCDLYNVVNYGRADYGAYADLQTRIMDALRDAGWSMENQDYCDWKFIRTAYGPSYVDPKLLWGPLPEIVKEDFRIIYKTVIRTMKKSTGHMHITIYQDMNRPETSDPEEKPKSDYRIQIDASHVIGFEDIIDDLKRVGWSVAKIDIGAVHKAYTDFARITLWV